MGSTVADQALRMLALVAVAHPMGAQVHGKDPQHMDSTRVTDGSNGQKDLQQALACRALAGKGHAQVACTHRTVVASGTCSPCSAAGASTEALAVPSGALMLLLCC